MILGVLVAGCGNTDTKVDIFPPKLAHTDVATRVRRPGPWIPPPVPYVFPVPYWHGPYPPYVPPNSYPQYPVFISFFTASPSQTYKGDPVTLSWSTSNAAYVAVEGHGGTYPASSSIVVYPTETTVYNLRAFTADGVEGSSRYLQVNVVGRPPAVASFWANPNHINLRETSNLHIFATHCQEVQLSAVGDSSVSGRYPCLTDLSVSPNQTTTYTIRVIGTNGEVIDSSPVRIIVDAPPEKPVIESFFVTKSTVNLGETAELKWNVSRATRVEVTGFSGQAPMGGILPITPNQTTTYVLRAYSASGGISEAQATITVNIPVLPPQINDFRADNPVLEEGQAVRLSWSTTNCQIAEIAEDELRTVPCNGTMEEYPKKSKSYSLRVFNTKGDVDTRLVSVIVRPKAIVPIIDHFYASSMNLIEGQPTTIHWSVSHARRLEFAGLDLNNPPLRGSHTFIPQKSAAIRLNAYDDKGQVATSIVSIFVNASIKPSIGYFYGGGGTGYATVGKPFRLYWSVHNCSNVQITDVKTQNLMPKSSADIILQADKTLTLSCSGTDGKIIQSSIHVKTLKDQPSPQEALDALGRAMSGK